MLLSPSQVLLRYGSDPNYENIHGHVALHLAWDSWLKEINHPVFKAIKLNTAVQLITELLQYGAEPDCAMHNGKTPLHLAAGWGHAMICALLLRVRWLGHRGRERDLCRGQGAWGLRVCGRHGYNILFAIRCRLNAVYNARCGPIAFESQYKATPDLRDRTGQTPLDLATKRGYDYATHPDTRLWCPKGDCWGLVEGPYAMVARCAVCICAVLSDTRSAADCSSTPPPWVT